MDRGIRSEVKLYFNRQACWGLSWLIGYILLMIWWFALRDGNWAGLSFAYSGAALILAGLVILFIKMGPIIVINTTGLKLNTGYFGKKESMEIPWDRIKSVDTQKRYMRGRAHTPNNARLVLTFELTSSLDLKSGGYFIWHPEKKELDMNNSVTTGGFKRIVKIIGDFEPRLKNDRVRADLIGPLLARFIGVLLVVAVVGSGALALKEELIEKSRGPDDPRLIGVLNELAVLYRNEKQYEKLEKVLRRIITIQGKVYGPDHCKVAHRLHSLASIYALQPERYGDAEFLYKKAIAICRKSCPDDVFLPAYINDLQELYKVRDRK